MAKESYHNKAAGDARVGIMVGKVTGGVHQHSDSLRVERLQQQLAELRRRSSTHGSERSSLPRSLPQPSWS